MRLLFVFLFAASAVLGSCHAQRLATADSTSTTQPLDSAKRAIPSVEFLNSKLDSNALLFQTFSARTKVNYDNSTSAQNLTASFRLKSDSLLWASFSLIGIEGARVVASEDSFWLHNRLSRELSQQPLSELANTLYLPLDFQNLQNLLLGKRFEVSERVSFVVEEDSAFLLLLEGDHLLQKLWLNKTNYTIQRLVLIDKMLSQQLACSFDAYNMLEGKPFAYTRDIRITRGQQQMNLQIEFTRAGVNEVLSFPFGK